MWQIFEINELLSRFVPFLNFAFPMYNLVKKVLTFGYK